jgi:glucose-6-phosphate isomerase/transaldolase/glucose-6-phosphate isomerase
VAIGGDHGGYALKGELLPWLESQGYRVMHLGAHALDPGDDYPDLARLVAAAVASGQASRGVLICGSGAGACIAANKVPGARAGLCHDTYSARQGVEHDDMNVLCLGGRVVGVELAKELVRAFLEARFSGEERHRRRLDKVAELERSFADSFDSPPADVVGKRAGLPSRKRSHPGVGLGSLLPEVESALKGLEGRRVIHRIWLKDPTVWKPDPREIANRLGWLAVTDTMREQVPALESFAGEVKAEGYRHVVLLGMGGSSLGPEVLQQTFGSAAGYPSLVVLDSTLPAVVRGVERCIDPAATLFLVSSKSGGTIEPLSFYKHFRRLVEVAVGPQKAGHSFVAITDPGTSLEARAREQGFRRVFLNPPDVGGRYSVLSYFGLVPAALMGLDIRKLLERAGRVREGCASRVPASDNPGAWLGVVMGTLALRGRDKLTLVISPAIAGFGLWVEQLLAESTGKEGRGIVPIAREPLGAPGRYGDDRVFVYLRLAGDDNAFNDRALEGIERSGQPVVRLDLGDEYDLGGEFFRWEFATAVAGAVLGIHPFDQPDVQGAKDMTDRMLLQHRREGRLPLVEAPGDLSHALAQAKPGDYLAIMAYIPQTAETEGALDQLRRTVLERHGTATTLGYGPRFLHSTGQLHKGGPNTVICLQLTADDGPDVPIPGEPYSFGVLAEAQAAGDLQALQASGRRIVRVDVGPDPAHGIRRLAAELS